MDRSIELEEMRNEILFVSSWQKIDIISYDGVGRRRSQAHTRICERTYVRTYPVLGYIHEPELNSPAAVRGKDVHPAGSSVLVKFAKGFLRACMHD